MIAFRARRDRRYGFDGPPAVRSVAICRVLDLYVDTEMILKEEHLVAKMALEMPICAGHMSLMESLVVLVQLQR